MVGEETGHHLIDHFTVIFGQGHIFFFINSFQFGMKSPDNRMLKPIGLYFSPVLYLIRRNIFLKNSLVVRSIGICPGSSDRRHQFIVFIGNSDLRGLIRHTVDLTIESSPLSLVRRFPIYLEQSFYPVQHRFLLFVILCSETIRSFEHQVLKIVGQPGRLCRIVLSTGADGDIGLNPGLIFIDRHIHL